MQSKILDTNSFLQEILRDITPYDPAYHTEKQIFLQNLKLVYNELITLVNSNDEWVKKVLECHKKCYFSFYDNCLMPPYTKHKLEKTFVKLILVSNGMEPAISLHWF